MIISVQIQLVCQVACSIDRSIGQCWWLAGVCWQLHCVQWTLPACRQSHIPLENQSGKTFNQHVGYFVRVWLYGLPFSRYSVWSWRPLLRRMLQIFHANKLHRFSLLPMNFECEIKLLVHMKEIKLIIWYLLDCQRRSWHGLQSMTTKPSLGDFVGFQRWSWPLRPFVCKWLVWEFPVPWIVPNKTYLNRLPMKSDPSKLLVKACASSVSLTRTKP